MKNCEEERQKFIEENEYDPCEGCLRCDYGYNCKHCKYGDDGNYSIYDVYRPSELL